MGALDGSFLVRRSDGRNFLFSFLFFFVLFWGYVHADEYRINASI